MSAEALSPRTLRIPVLHLGRLRGALVVEVGAAARAASRPARAARPRFRFDATAVARGADGVRVRATAMDRLGY